MPERAFDRIVLIFNPAPGGTPAAAAARLHAVLRERLPGTPVRLAPTAGPGHGRVLARSEAELPGDGRPLLISVSGDGGYHDVVNGAMEGGGRAVCAVLGAGNANDHRRSTRTEPLLRAIERGHLRHIDLLRLQVGEGSDGWSRWAHSYVGFGLTPRMAIGIERGVKGRYSELVSVARVLRSLAPIEITRTDGATAVLDSLILANVTGVAKYGRISAGPSPDDGLFEVLLLPHAAKWRIGLMTLRAVTIGLEPEASVARYGFTSPHAIPLQIDGEVLEVPAGASVLVESVPRTLVTLG
ncbi:MULTISPECIES: diacylglycerol kinase family protein [Arthrobacter]|uniref:Diacylglycerol kinase family protein n=2 Tax=Arthrobacter TaxID=1663 RepID=A0ABU9KJV6_9MICC|nr:diacylglycerol kinase family protein [Arthrobacter sp. YJM1]MDP5226522.1 diacylglycerol kinase family protein [Arthrobacter sp. YJM1]